MAGQLSGTYRQNPVFSTSEKAYDSFSSGEATTWT